MSYMKTLKHTQWLELDKPHGDGESGKTWEFILTQHGLDLG